MNQYHTLTASGELSWQEQLGQLHGQMTRLIDSMATKSYRLTFTKVFLSDATNQMASLMASRLYTDFIAPVEHSVIEQPPLAEGAKIALLVVGSDLAAPSVLHDTWRLSNEDVAVAKDSYSQTILLMERYIERLQRCGQNLADHCLRTWIYVRDIDNNYAGMVKARNDLFARHGLTTDTHFLVSTGIGGASSVPGALVSMDTLTTACGVPADVKYLEALDHLNRTHEYGVAFERGGWFTVGDDKFCLIAGTASINCRGQIINEGDVLSQAARVHENIGALLSDAALTLQDVCYYVVYVRDASDRTAVMNYLKTTCPHVPHIVVHAPVCRSGWLIEMECVARRR